MHEIGCRDGLCERCSRLAKECIAAPAIRRTNPGRNARQTGGSKTAKIEQKLDSLVAMLQSRAPLALPQMVDVPIHGLTANQKFTTSHEDALSSDPPTNEPFSSPASFHAATADPEGIRRSQNERDVTSLSEHDAEEALSFFRSRFLPAFPFMYISASSTAETIRRKYPNLWLCVISITRKSLKQKRILGDLIRKSLTRGILVNQERNHDLLLACISYMGWVHHHMKEEPHLTTWVRLMRTVVIDLQLNQAPHAHESHELQVNRCIAQQRRNVDKRRTVLGAYLISSVIYNFQNTEEPFQWTPYMEECLQELAHDPQWNGDQVLVSQIKFYRVVNQIPYSLREKPRAGAVISLVMALHGHLQEIQRNLSSDLKQNHVLLLFFYSAKILVDEMEFDSHVPDPGKAGLDANASTAAQIQRLECLHRCLDSVDAWCGVFFSIPGDVFFELPFSIVSYQLGRSLKMLFNLTFLCEPGWDCNQVRAKVDLFEAIDNIASGLDKVEDLLDGDDGVEELSVKKLSRALRINKSAVQVEFLSRQQRASSYAGAEEEQHNLPEMVFSSAGYPLNFSFEDQWTPNTNETWETMGSGGGWVAGG